MKIADIEARIEQGDCSEETIELFKEALKRVPKFNRCQHCYITAVSMPSRFHKQAIEMIQYGLDEFSEFCETWIDRQRSYVNMAIILERIGDYGGALKSLKEALDSIDPQSRSSYEHEYAAHMMRLEMHINDFEYSDDLLNYYRSAGQEIGFAQAIQSRVFYRLIAEIIIFKQQGDLTSAKKAFESANEMLQPDYESSLTQLLKRKRFIETTGATKEAEKFLKSMDDFFYSDGKQLYNPEH